MSKNSNVQAILFDRKIWSENGAKRWILDHNFNSVKQEHLTKNKIRFRIKDPNEFSYFRTKKLPPVNKDDMGVEFIIGFS